jgi:hypothetical protein
VAEEAKIADLIKQLSAVKKRYSDVDNNKLRLEL